MSSKFRIGIDLGGTKIECIGLGLDGQEIYRERVAAPAGAYGATIATIRDIVGKAEQTMAGTGTVGLGIPGSFSRRTGLVQNANTTWLIGQPLLQDLEAALHRPIRIDNDANCFAVSEATDGAARGAAVMLGVILGTGVGAGIALHGRPVVGVNAIAGEWGHNPLPWTTDDERPGDQCYCGRAGCIETFLSGPALERAHARATGEAIGVPEIARRGEAGDPAAADVLARYEDRLARGLAHVMNILDPDVIVLGGGLSNIVRLYSRIPQLWGPYLFSDTVVTRLRPPVHGDSSGVRGAAWLWPAPGPVSA